MSFHHSTTRSIIFICCILILLAFAPPIQSISIPAGFSDELVTRVARPTALAFTPDGRMLIASQLGQVRIYQGTQLLSQPALDLSNRLCADYERGLLGIAVDPQFATSRSIYLYYTYNKHNTCARASAQSPVNRVSRFTLSDTNRIDPTSEAVLIDNIPSPQGMHNAGDLQFGKDGYLYISIGDGTCHDLHPQRCDIFNDVAREPNVLLGKILRITSDGRIPSSNPFTGPNSARCHQTGRIEAGKQCQEIFASGLRNPFRMAFDPNAADTRFYINDVGANVWEEINLGQKGADYGWNLREGFCLRNSTTDCGSPPPGLTNPIYAYDRRDGCKSITGGAFVPRGAWPRPYDGAYLFGDYVCGTIFHLVPQGEGFIKQPLLSGLGVNSATTMTFGPYAGGQALYYTSFASSQIRRLSYVGDGNRAPIADLTASPTAGLLPLEVRFDARASRDPDPGDQLTYIWSFGDGTAPVEGRTPAISHTYRRAGVFTAQLEVRDNHGATSTPVTLRIDAGNQPPQPRILLPAEETRFRVGETITLRGSASDPQDGTLPPAALSWRVTLHHDDHTHPFLPPTRGNETTFTAPPPENLLAATNSHLEIELTATDSWGLSSVVTHTLHAQRVALTFETEPAGMRLIINGETHTGPQTLTSWHGYTLHVLAAPQPHPSGTWFAIEGWSDGNPPARQIETPGRPSTYTARFGPTNIIALPMVGR